MADARLERHRVLFSAKLRTDLSERQGVANTGEKVLLRCVSGVCPARVQRISEDNRLAVGPWDQLKSLRALSSSRAGELSR